MTVRSKVMQPKLWAQKAPEFVNEARRMGINIHAPYIQSSSLGFTVKDTDVYFGLNAIKQVGIAACRSIITARKSGPFKDIWDFLSRINRRKVNTRVFEALVYAGSFDRMGYAREDLIEHTKGMYAYFSDIQDYELRIQDKSIREKENADKDLKRNAMDTELKDIKLLIRTLKKAGQPIPEGLMYITQRSERLRDYRKRVTANQNATPQELLSYDELQEYNKNIWLRKKPMLRLKEEPVRPELNRTRQVRINVKQLMEQADFIGCYLQDHPARVIYPDSTPIANAEVGDYVSLSGQVTNYKAIKTKRGQDMAFMEFGDGTGMAEGVIFSSIWTSLNASNRLPKQGDVVLVTGKVDNVNDTLTKIKVNRLNIYRPPKE